MPPRCRPDKQAMDQPKADRIQQHSPIHSSQRALEMDKLDMRRPVALWVPALAPVSIQANTIAEQPYHL
eukprot:1617803-Lingulodinium_polyedra.AAC.1